MIAEQVTKRTYANTTGESRGNIGAISLPNYAVVVDTGMYPAFAQEFRTYLEKTTGTPVTKVILTHYHGDHIFGNQVFKDCEIIANRVLAVQMREAASTQWTREALEQMAKERPDTYGKLDLDSLEITFPTEVFDKSFTLTDDGFEIVCKQVGGHSVDSAYVYFPADRVLFVGDLLFTRMFPWGGDPTADLDAWIQVFKEFQRLAVEKIVPGHGAVCDLEEVQAYLNFYEPVAKIMKDLITEGRTQDEVVEFDGYPDFYPSETPERRNDTLAHWYQVYQKKFG